MVEPTSVPDPSDVSDAIGELARARRERVVEASAAPQPEWLESIQAGEITYTFRPSALPFRQMDPQAFIHALKDAYRLTVDRLDLSPLLEQITIQELGHLDEREVLDHLVRAPRGSLRLSTGKFAQRSEFYPIKFVTVDFESISVQIAGPTVIAETIARDVAEMMWAAVGVTKQWPAIEPALMLIAYGTTTRVLLPDNSNLLLNPGLRNFLETSLNQGPTFARDFAGKPAPSGEPRGAIHAVPCFDSLSIRIGVLNLATGYDAEASLDFDVSATSDHGSGRVMVTSQLPYERHVALLDKLVQALS
jgi:hypothetical protein